MFATNNFMAYPDRMNHNYDCHDSSDTSDMTKKKKKFTSWELKLDTITSDNSSPIITFLFERVKCKLKCKCKKLKQEKKKTHH